MTIHTIWGDFESEEELIKTGARMMGISYKKAKAIREKALKEHEEERKRIERAIQERKDLEQSILDKIKAKFPDLHFKACPWCGEEPHIEVNVGCNYWLDERDRPTNYWVELHSCEHLYKHGSVLNSYNIDEIPDQPTHPNPKYTWMGDWEDHGWEYAVKEYEKYLSDDYPRKCAKCGKKWRGYEDYNIPEVDGKQYCWECCELFDHWDNHIPVVKNSAQYYHDYRNLSTMYDDGPQFYTSLHNMLKCRGIKESDIEVKFKGTGERRASDRLTGSLTGERYEIYYVHKKLEGTVRWCIAYVREPRDKEELQKYLKQS